MKGACAASLFLALVAASMVLFLSCSGGSGGSAHDSGVEPVIYSGLNSAAVIDSRNAEILAAGALLGGPVYYPSTWGIVETNFSNYPPSALGPYTPLSLSWITDNVHALLAEAVDGRGRGSCPPFNGYACLEGGTYDPFSGNFDLSFIFNGYEYSWMSRGYYLSGELRVTGSIDVTNAVLISEVNARRLDIDIYVPSSSLSGTWRIERDTGSTRTTFNAAILDRQTNLTYRLEEYAIEKTQSADDPMGTFFDAAVSGTFCHPHYGCVDVSTDQQLRIYSDFMEKVFSAYPIGGELRVAGADSTMARLQSTDHAQYQVAADLDGDGVADDLVSGLRRLPGVNLRPIVVLNRDSLPFDDYYYDAGTGCPVLLDGTGTFDVDGDDLSLHWNILARPTGSVAAFADSGAAGPVFTFDLPGTYLFQLDVEDAYGATASGRFEVMTADLPFCAADSFSGWGPVSALKVADMSGDGRMDILAVAESANGTGKFLLLLVQDPDGTWGEPMPIAQESQTVSMAVEDLDGNGYPDIVAGRMPQAGFPGQQLGIIYQESNLVFGSWVFHPPSLVSSYPEVGTGDMNGDGFQDVVLNGYHELAGAYSTQHFEIFYGTGTGGLSEPVAYDTRGGIRTGTHVTDVNSDGRADFISKANTPYDVLVMAQNQSGGFSSPVFYNVVPGQKTIIDDLHTGDLNHDGRTDLAACFQDSEQNRDLAIFHQGQTGQLGSAVGYVSQAWQGFWIPSAAIKTGDVDGDGLEDVILSKTGYTMVHNQQADGTMGVPTHLHSGAVLFEVADMNGDGSQDVVLAPSGGGIVFLLGKPR